MRASHIAACLQAGGLRMIDDLRELPLSIGRVKSISLAKKRPTVFYISCGSLYWWWYIYEGTWRTIRQVSLSCVGGGPSLLQSGGRRPRECQCFRLWDLQLRDESNLSKGCHSSLSSARTFLVQSSPRERVHRVQYIFGLKRRWNKEGQNVRLYQLAMYRM